MNDSSSNSCAFDTPASKLNRRALSSPAVSTAKNSPSAPSQEDSIMGIMGNKVQFSKNCRMRLCSHNKSPQRKSKVWYSADDYQVMRGECSLTINLAKKALSLCATDTASHTPQDQENTACYSCEAQLACPTFDFRPSEYSCRGLEHHICSQMRHRRRDRRIQALTAVYHEQVRQYDTDSYSPERIAEVYREISEACQREAHARALQYWNEEHQERDEDESSSSVMVGAPNPNDSYFLQHREQDTTMHLGECEEQ